MDDLFQRARSVKLGDVEARTLSPVDSLLHLCVHAALDGGTRLRALKDIEYAYALCADDPFIVRRARSWRVARLAALMLQRASATLGFELAPRTVETLDPSAMHRAINAWVDRVRPVALADAERNLAGVWAKFTRDSLAASVQAAARRIPSSRRIKSERSERAPAVLAPKGGAEDRSEFFDRIGERRDPKAPG
jgi:hypothetical protein